MLAERQIDEAISRLEEKIIALQLRPATQMIAARHDRIALRARSAARAGGQVYY